MDFGDSCGGRKGLHHGKALTSKEDLLPRMIRCQTFHDESRFRAIRRQGLLGKNDAQVLQLRVGDVTACYKTNLRIGFGGCSKV